MQHGWCPIAVLASILACAAAPGCAGIHVERDTVEPLSALAPGPNASAWESFAAPFVACWRGFTRTFEPRGIRYCQSAVLITVVMQKDRVVKVGHELVPDPSRRMSARPYAVLSLVDELKMDFERGMLKATTAKFDATTVPKAVLAAATEVAKTVASTAGTAAVLDAPSEQPTLRVFRLRPDPRGSGYQLVDQDGNAYVVTP